MIYLARKDIEHSLGKFLVTAMGVGMLLGMVLIMIGVYRGMVVDAEILINDINADLWIVQENSMGPFAESSRVHEDLKYSINIIDGVKHSEAITFQNIQLPKNPMPIRVMAVGYDPFGKINPINEERLIAGTKLTKDHFQIVVSKETGFKLQDKIMLDADIYEVVGITEKTVSSSGDILIYISLKDAQKLQFSYSNNQIRSDRERGIKNSDITMVNAIVASIKEGYNIQEVANNIKQWKYKSVYTKKEQEDILTKNLIERSAKQIGLFTAILIFLHNYIVLTFFRINGLKEHNFS